MHFSKINAILFGKKKLEWDAREKKINRWAASSIYVDDISCHRIAVPRLPKSTERGIPHLWVGYSKLGQFFEGMLQDLGWSAGNLRRFLVLTHFVFLSGNGLESNTNDLAICRAECEMDCGRGISKLIPTILPK